MALALGMGKPAGFPLKGEKGGLIPTRQWKKKRFQGASWYDGETVIASIGQGYVLATPLQLAVMTAAVANGGTVLRPRLIKKVENWEGEELMAPEREVVNAVDLRPASLSAVRRGLEAVVNEPHGTGRATRFSEVRVAGKTGTAQVVRRKSDEEELKKEADPYRFRDHALFVAYAPADHPKLAVAVVVEHGGHGGSAAAPIARAMFESHLGLGAHTPAGESADAGD
jgi:penicillin-binding protein 2